MILPGDVEFKTFKNTESWKDAKAICWKFELSNAAATHKIIEALSNACIDSERSLEGDRKHAQFLIDSGTYSWKVDPKNGIDYEDLPDNVKAKLANRGPGRKWSKWTVEDVLYEWGWREDEVYWFSIETKNDYTDQLILKDGDWICYCPALKYQYQLFLNVGEDCNLPEFSSWVEVPRLF